MEMCWNPRDLLEKFLEECSLDFVFGLLKLRQLSFACCSETKC